VGVLGQQEGRICAKIHFLTVHVFLTNIFAIMANKIKEARRAHRLLYFKQWVVLSRLTVGLRAPRGHNPYCQTYTVTLPIRNPPPQKKNSIKGAQA
jgi:hypothetical protein